MKVSEKNRNIQISLKPYSLYFKRLYDRFNLNFQELEDLKDLKHAAIKILTIKSSEFSFVDKSRRNIIELLRNTNIKKILLELDDPSADFLIFISKLILENTTIKEIHLFTRFNNYSKKELMNKAWLYFINTISSRLVKLTYKDYSDNFNLKFRSLLLRNTNLKEIEIINYSNDNTYSGNIKDILSSEKYLDIFRIDVMEAFNNEFYDSLRKLKTKAEIDTLYIESTNTVDSLATIENAYLFKIKTIKISKLSELTIFDTIFKLSNNPHNTVKRIIFDKSEKNFDES